MTTRREILAAIGGAGAASIWAGAAAAGGFEATGGERDLYELRRYLIGDERQKLALDGYLREAAIPALNRIGVDPVGVFHPEKELSPVTVLIRHRTPESLLACGHRLLGDASYLKLGADFLNAPADTPAYQRMESSVLLAFKGMPALETPVKSAGRILQLRTYESPSVKTGQKKIEMFNDAGEIALFRQVGLHPVFFGEALFGGKLPNLTYMLAFESPEELKANWAKFVGSPEWKTLSKRPEYSDKAILSGITNVILKPAGYSQI